VLGSDHGDEMQEIFLCVSHEVIPDRQAHAHAGASKKKDAGPIQTDRGIVSAESISRSDVTRCRLLLG
jgi:hypothetical protein